jgi:RHS repeat-associated protein
MSKTVGSTKAAFTWNTTATVPTLISDGTLSYFYGPDGSPLEQIDGSGNVTWYHHDQRGTTRILTNASGSVVGSFTYDAYGNETGHSGTVTSPLGYDSQYADPETDLTYLRNRYYDPTTGQFLSRDPAPVLTKVAYSYAADNPVNRADPTGLDPCIDANGTIGAGGCYHAGVHGTELASNNNTPVDCLLEADPFAESIVGNNLETPFALEQFYANPWNNDPNFWTPNTPPPGGWPAVQLPSWYYQTSNGPGVLSVIVTIAGVVTATAACIAGGSAGAVAGGAVFPLGGEFPGAIGGCATAVAADQACAKLPRGQRGVEMPEPAKEWKRARQVVRDDMEAAHPPAQPERRTYRGLMRLPRAEQREIQRAALGAGGSYPRATLEWALCYGRVMRRIAWLAIPIEVALGIAIGATVGRNFISAVLGAGIGMSVLTIVYYRRLGVAMRLNRSRLRSQA